MKNPSSYARERLSGDTVAVWVSIRRAYLISEEDGLRLGWERGSLSTSIYGFAAAAYGAVSAMLFANPAPVSAIYFTFGAAILWIARAGSTGNILEVEDNGSSITVVDEFGKVFIGRLSEPTLRIVKAHVAWANGYLGERIDER